MPGVGIHRIRRRSGCVVELTARNFPESATRRVAALKNHASASMNGLRRLALPLVLALAIGALAACGGESASPTSVEPASPAEGRQAAAATPTEAPVQAQAQATPPPGDIAAPTGSASGASEVPVSDTPDPPPTEAAAEPKQVPATTEPTETATPTEVAPTSTPEMMTWHPTEEPEQTVAPAATATATPTPAPQATVAPTSAPTLRPTATTRATDTPEPTNRAPDFSLNDTGGNPVSLQSYRGNQHLVLVFYRGFW